jgi:hypothetical protein
MTEQLIEPGNVQHSILAEFKKRMSSDVLESLFEGTSLLHSSMGRTNYLRKLVRDSLGCDEQFNKLATHCRQHTGAIFGRRASFRMGVCLGILMCEQMPHSDAPKPRVLRPGKREKQEIEQPCCETQLEAVGVEA